ncbi:proteasome-activating nucleotidase [Candidatus Woesearchaeota archaeon]|nr:proteasome-activating nucleotidase [Candidatus Woesearchaeota archaeon]MBL7050563.1 proteasome-activating nucleotidase [Candidatus Woesearchaeota archaeon]
MSPKANNKEREISYNYEIDSISQEESVLLREAVSELRKEVDKFKSTPLMVAEVKEIYKENVIIRIQNGNQFFVNISNECEKILPGDQVLVEQRNLTIIKKVELSKNFDVEKFIILEKPTIKWNDVGGLNEQMEEIKEVIELPLKKPKLFKKIGIQPPKGILLYGPPGTGKTILAKAVAASTNSTFIEIVGSELVQKFIGEGAKLVKEIFTLAKAKSPTIIFIDELDAIAATRIDVGTSGEREVQRTFMQFLAEIDGFKHLENVKVIGCTNRKDILDPAVTRPGRLDRLIEIPLPNKEGKKEIFKIHTKNMLLDKKIDIDKIIKQTENFSGAEIKAVCTEAGYFAIRKNRINITEKDFLKAIKKVKAREKAEGKDYMNLFG